MSGKLQIPVGVTWNTTSKAGQHLSRISKQEAEGGIVFAWHSQTWAMHMFRITESDSARASSVDRINRFHFEKGGGRQGGKQQPLFVLPFKALASQKSTNATLHIPQAEIGAVAINARMQGVGVANTKIPPTLMILD